jgi:hypothetical protein
MPKTTPRFPRQRVTDSQRLKTQMTDETYSPQLKMELLLRSKTAPPGPRHCLLCSGKAHKLMLWVDRRATRIDCAFTRDMVGRVLVMQGTS